MSKRVWIASVVGAVAMFIWMSVAHVVLPLGEAGIKQIDNEAPLLASMQSTLPNPGMYMFPNMDPKDQAANEKKIATGPSGLLVYFPERHFQPGKAMVIEFVTELVLVIIAMYLLTLTRINTFARRLGFFALIGLCVGSAANVSYWNWYGFSTTYTLAYCFIGWIGYVCAGLVAGAMKVGSAQAG